MNKEIENLIVAWNDNKKYIPLSGYTCNDTRPKVLDSEPQWFGFEKLITAVKFTIEHNYETVYQIDPDNKDKCYLIWENIFWVY
jgi:hypothetical protein